MGKHERKLAFWTIWKFCLRIKFFLLMSYFVLSKFFLLIARLPFPKKTYNEGISKIWGASRKNSTAFLLNMNQQKNTQRYSPLCCSAREIAPLWSWRPPFVTQSELDINFMNRNSPSFPVEISSETIHGQSVCSSRSLKTLSFSLWRSSNASGIKSIYQQT